MRDQVQELIGKAINKGFEIEEENSNEVILTRRNEYGQLLNHIMGFLKPDEDDADGLDSMNKFKIVINNEEDTFEIVGLD